MILLGSVLALVLAAIAALHAYWGFGGVWPGTDPESAARAVTGFRGMRAMPPPAACLAVAALLVVTLIVALMLAGLLASPAPAIVRFAGVAIGLVFVARGLLGYTPFWRRLTPEQPFAANDARYYSPLCLALGAGFLILAFFGASE